MYVCVNMILCYNILFLAMYIAVLSTATTDEQCFPVRECGDIPALPFDRLSYSVAINQWHHTYSRICPRSDSSVPHWDIMFVDAGSVPLAGSYCIKGKNFSSSDVCVKNDATTLTFLNLTSFHNTTQSLDVVFNGTDFLATFPLEIAPTGVTAVPSVVYISSGDDSIHLTWYVHSAQEVKSFEIKHKGIVVANQSTINSDPSICFLSTDGEITEVFTMEIINPTESSTGEYTFLMGSSYSDVVTVELDSSYFIEPTPSVMLSSSPAAATAAFSVSPQLTVSSVTVESSHPVQSDTTKQYTSSALSQESSSLNGNTNTMSPSSESSVGANYSVLWIVISAAAAVVSVVLLASVTVVGILCWTKRHEKQNDVHYRQDGGEMSNYSSSSTFRMKKTSVVGPYDTPDGHPSPLGKTVITVENEGNDGINTGEATATDSDQKELGRIVTEKLDELSKKMDTTFEKLEQGLQSSADAREERIMHKMDKIDSKEEEHFHELSDLGRSTLGIMETTFVDSDDKQEEEVVRTRTEEVVKDNDSRNKLQESDDSGTGEDLCSSDEQNN